MKNTVLLFLGTLFLIQLHAQTYEQHIAIAQSAESANVTKSALAHYTHTIGSYAMILIIWIVSL